MVEEREVLAMTQWINHHGYSVKRIVDNLDNIMESETHIHTKDMIP